jgi:hypothetical protein
VRQLENTLKAAIIRAAGTGARQVERSHLFPASIDAPETDPRVRAQAVAHSIP